MSELSYPDRPPTTYGKAGRGERIRTSGPCLPKTVLYQAELLPDRNPLLRCDLRSRREPGPRLDRWGFGQAQAPPSAAEDSEPVARSDELLARRAGSGAAGLALLDLPPVVIVGRHHAALFEQLLEPRRPLTVSGRPGRHRRGDLVGDLVAV